MAQTALGRFNFANLAWGCVSRAGIALALASAVTACSAPPKAEPVKQHVFVGNDTEFARPVAITNVGGSDYLVANYSNVALFESSTGAINKIDVENPEFVEKFIPTAFSVDSRTGSIFIANNAANNVIVATFDKARLKLHLDRLIGDEKTLTPEGVAVSGGMVAVTNYDGGNVQFFDQTKPNATAACTISVAQAHGVVFLGEFAYVTSLTDRELLKIDPRACSITARVGEAGWKPNQFLWPTGVAVWDDKSVAVADAHTGLISVWGANRLDFIKSFGGNGPGQNEMNMPYGLAIGSSDLFVTSTFSDKIVRFDKASGHPQESWSAHPGWNEIADGSLFTLNHADHALNSADWGAYTETGTTIIVDGACYHPGYGELVSCNGGENLPINTHVVGFVYFIQVAREGDRTLIFSPQASYALVIGPEGWAQRKETFIGLDHWLIAGRAIGPNGAFEIDAASATASEPR